MKVEEKTMANNSKERIVTRTIKSTIVRVSCYNRKIRAFVERSDVFTGKFEAGNEILIAAHFNGIDEKYIETLSVSVKEEKYALPERLFIQYGKRITEAEAEEIENEE